MENITILNALSYAIFLCNPHIPNEGDKILYCLDEPKKAEDIKYNGRLNYFVRAGLITCDPEGYYSRNSGLRILPEMIPDPLREVFTGSDTDIFYKAVITLDDLCFFGSRNLTRHIILRYLQIIPDLSTKQLELLIPSKHPNNITIVVANLEKEGLLESSDVLRITKKGSRYINKITEILEGENMSYLLPVTQLLKLRR